MVKIRELPRDTLVIEEGTGENEPNSNESSSEDDKPNISTVSTSYRGRKGLANAMNAILTRPIVPPGDVIKVETDEESEDNKEIVNNGVIDLIADKKLKVKKEKKKEQLAKLKLGKRLTKTAQQKMIEIENLARVKPDRLKERLFERQMLTIATKGVVQLFNTVKEHQASLELVEKEKGVTSTNKERKLKELSKPGKFLDKLDSKAEKPKTWDVLTDDYLEKNGELKHPNELKKKKRKLKDETSDSD